MLYPHASPIDAKTNNLNYCEFFALQIDDISN